MSQRVLVVDDDEMLRDMLAAMLRHGGYEPVLADSGRQGLEIFGCDPPQLAFVDIVMPDMDGMAFATAVKAANPEAYLCAISGYGADSFEQDWRDVGFDDFLEKPIDLWALLTAAAAAFADIELD